MKPAFWALRSRGFTRDNFGFFGRTWFNAERGEMYFGEENATHYATPERAAADAAEFQIEHLVEQIPFVACNNQFKEQLARMLCLNAGTRAPTMPSLLEIQQLLPDLSK
jgi:hypothetical protein